MKNKIVLTLLAGLAVLSSCTWVDPLPVGSVTVDVVDSQRIYELDFTGKSALEVTLNNVLGKDVFVVQSNASRSPKSPSVDVRSARSLQDSQRTVPSSRSRLITPEEYPPIRDWQKKSAIAFQPENARAAAAIPGATSSAAYTTSQLDSGVGTLTQSFWLDYFDDRGTASTSDDIQSFHQVNAVLRGVGDSVYVWVTDGTDGGSGTNHPLLSSFDNYGSSSSDTDGIISDAQIATLIEKMDGEAPGDLIDSRGIYQLTSDLIGFEKGGGPSGDGGIDGHSKVHILIYDMGGDLADGNLIGYFWGKDEYSTENSNLWWGYPSNEMEIFYIDSYFLDSQADMTYSTLAHEYQHMIHFNQISLTRNADSAAWYNEMCSMLIEDVLQAHLGIADVDSPKGRTRDYIDYYMDSGVIDWHATDTWRSYASAYMFGAFLVRNYGGAAFLEALFEDPTLAEESAVTAALALTGHGDEDFNSVFEKYVTAHVFDVELPASGATDQYTFTINTDGDLYGNPSDDYRYPVTAFSMVNEYNGSSYQIDSDNYYILDSNGNRQLWADASKWEYGPMWSSMSYSNTLRPFGVYLTSYTDLQPSDYYSIGLKLKAPSTGVKVQIMIRDTMY